jgi:hypothetical protein
MSAKRQSPARKVKVDRLRGANRESAAAVERALAEAAVREALLRQTRAGRS